MLLLFNVVAVVVNANVVVIFVNVCVNVFVCVLLL